MCVRKFLSRDAELNLMEDIYSTPGFKLYPIYGRRRIGKTALIKQFLTKHGGIYYLCTTGGTKKNLKFFSKKVSEHLKIPPMEVSDFRDVFSNLIKMGEDDIIIAIDEFPYLIVKDNNLIGEFQYVIDEILADSNIMIILCGSSIGMMENYVLTEKSPLYGRRRGQMQIKEIDRFDIPLFLPNFTFRETIEIQSMVGGIPRYLQEFSDIGDLRRTLQRSFLSSDGYLYREAYLLLHDELREPDTYMNILEAMASGRTKVTEIANGAYLEAKDMTKYLKVLERLGIINRIQPVTDRRPFSKKSLYFITDNYYRFWFRFIQPDRDYIEFREPAVPLKNIMENLNSHVSWFFEDYVKEMIRRTLGYPRLGKWWFGEDEIDVVGIDERSKRLLACECKWRDKKQNADIIERLINKAEKIEGFNNYKKEYLVVSRSGFTKAAINKGTEKNIMLWNLTDLEKIHKGH